MSEVTDIKLKEITHAIYPTSIVFFLPYFYEIVGTNGEKMNPENSGATIMIDTIRALIKGSSNGELLNFFST
jgi:hypothetical protein